MLQPDDDEGHVVAAVLAVALHRLGAAEVENFLAEVGQNDAVAGLLAVIPGGGAGWALGCFFGGLVQTVLDIVDEVLVGESVPHAVRGDHDEVPGGGELERLDLGDDADDLLPRRLVDLALQEEVAEAAGRNQDAANTGKK